MAANASRKIEKITLGEMRSSGVRGLLIYCSDYRCSHYIGRAFAEPETNELLGRVPR
jgi:hypothetical protein